jgi:outer membrane beta-barrel protein
VVGQLLQQKNGDRVVNKNGFRKRGTTVKKITLMIVFLAISWMRPAVAEEKPKELKDRISSVSNRTFVKARRLELMVFPCTSISLNDAFYQKLGLGGGLAYHISEAFAIQVIGTYTLDKLNLKTENTSLYTSDNKGATIPYSGKRTWLADIDLTWAPIYGKISVASEAVMHFDTYLLLGFGAVGGELAKNKTHVGLAMPFGLGIRLFFTHWLALKAELKDFMIFNDKTTINKEGSQSSSGVQHQLMFNLGLSFFFLQGIVEE